MRRRRFWSTVRALAVATLGTGGGCAAFGGKPLTPTQLRALTSELSAILEAVANRVIGPGAGEALRALGSLVDEARSALAVARTAAAAAEEGALVEPAAVRALFERFLAAYEALWLGLKASGMLGPEGQLLGVGDGGVIPSPDDCRRCVARHLGDAT